MRNKLSKVDKYVIFPSILLLYALLIGVVTYSLGLLNDDGSWFKWKVNILIPLGLWIATIPIYIIYVKFIKSTSETSTKLASSNWMEDREFRKLFTHHTEGENNWGSKWVIRTNIARDKKLNFSMGKGDGHAIVIGSTGSGKTARLINPNIRINALSKEKPSMILSDPKGELFNTHSQFLVDEGYEVLTINLRDDKKSSYWNPLDKIWDLWFPSDKKANLEEIREYALSHLNDLASSLFPIMSKDPFWDTAANAVFRFFVIAMLELAEKDKKIKREHFNITNIANNIQQTTSEELITLAEALPKNSAALAVGGRYVKGGGGNTVDNIFQVCVTALVIYTDPIIKVVTSKTTLKIDITRPQAIFIIVPDESKSKYPFISLFIAETYKELISIATKSVDGKLERKVLYLLDEFGNIPKIPQMDSMVTVSRSRNIFFMLLLQNYSQLDEKYGRNVANTIISNSSYEFFLLTADVDTAKKFSQKLGDRSLTATSRGTSSNERGSSSSSNESERTRKLILPDELMRLKHGEVILSLQRHLPIKTTLDEFWLWPKFKKIPMKIKNESTFSSYKKTHSSDFITLPKKKKKKSKKEPEVERDAFDEMFDKLSNNSKK